MDRCVVARNRPNRRANVLAAIDYEPPEPAGRCLMRAPVSRKTLPEQRLRGLGRRAVGRIFAEHGSFNAGCFEVRESQIHNRLTRKWLGMVRVSSFDAGRR